MRNIIKETKFIKYQFIYSNKAKDIKIKKI